MGTENLTAEERKKQIEEAEKSVKAMDDFTSPEKLYDEDRQCAQISSFR